MTKIKNIFIEGPIDPSLVAESIRRHTAKTTIGGHSIFLGQIREDMIGDKKLQSMYFTSYEGMALEKAHEIREQVITKYDLTCAHIYHSLGEVKVGEICLFVFTSAPHRKEAINACDELVDRIKKEIPLWGKEILEDDSHNWKENK